MKLDTSNYGPDEFGFYLQTNGAIDAEAFRDFLDILCGNTPRLRRYAPVAVEILELSNGSIWARLRAAFADEDWTDRQVARKAAAHDRAMIESQAATRQAGAAEQGNAIALLQIYLQAQANKKMDVQNRINLGLFLATMISLIYAATPSKEAQILCKLMEDNGIVCVEVASRDNRWVIERAHVSEYQERIKGGATTGRVDPKSRAAQRPIGRDRGDAFELEEDQRTMAIQERVRPVPTHSPVQRIIGRSERDGDAYRFYPEDHEFAEHVTLIGPENQDLFGDTRYEISGRIYRIPGQPPLLVARRATRLAE
ncbi:hypothetical protein ACWKWJ_14515 [Sphingopyxis terrae subsp. ummariensis]